jgi:hypothetical protein
MNLFATRAAELTKDRAFRNAAIKCCGVISTRQPMCCSPV